MHRFPSHTTALALLALVACGDRSAPPDPASAAVDAPAPDAREARPVADRIEVGDARIRAMPPGSPATGAFLTLTLTEGPGGAVVGGESPAAERVELHTHTRGEDGTMQMRELPRFGLTPDQPTVLAPGGLHLMLIGLTQELTVGAEIPLTLRFDDGSTTELQVPVAPIQPPTATSAPGSHEADSEADSEGAAEEHAGHEGM